MDVIILAGFLGSGKTTFILRAMESGAFSGRRTAVIVNDFGSVGIDGEVMSRHGLQVKEMAAGCICCTLGMDLAVAVNGMMAAYAPDVLIIEPSGLADPQAVIDALAAHPATGTLAVRTIAIVDALRFHAIVKALQRPFSAHLRAADAIIVNKVDAVGPADLESILAELKGMADVPTVTASATTGAGLREAAGLVLGE